MILFGFQPKAITFYGVVEMGHIGLLTATITGVEVVIGAAAASPQQHHRAGGGGATPNKKKKMRREERGSYLVFSDLPAEACWLRGRYRSHLLLQTIPKWPPMMLIVDEEVVLYILKSLGCYGDDIA
ncbi:serine/threonine-protein phosphatase [Sesbania bispinosa]|nr:serine/threonine-protein phosphatase [Sesbania bispinosa]